MSAIQNVIARILACLAGMTLASAAFAQTPRNSLDVSASTGVFEFKDPKTGQVWTPETVGQDGRPLTQPDDKAFNPQAQNVPLQAVEQRVRGRQVGTVPITAGPTVPIVAMDNASLRAVPGQRWQVVLYGQQQRQRGRPGRRVRLHQRRQARHGYARHRRSDWSGRARGIADLRPNGRHLR
jgi:hypothetical protein